MDGDALLADAVPNAAAVDDHVEATANAVEGSLPTANAVEGSLPTANAVEEASRVEVGRLLFARPCGFFHGAQLLAHLPAAGPPEIAFAGRSNVGKSSLVNALTGRRALARASNTPGRTRQLNFFDLAAGRLWLVDMPGYGYAQAGHAIKRDWQGLMLDYLRGRPTLRRVVLLLDARVPVKESDLTVMGLLDGAAVTFQLVLTKTDGVARAALARKRGDAAALVRAHAAAFPDVIATSSDTGDGIAALRASLAGLAQPLDDGDALAGGAPSGETRR